MKHIIKLIKDLADEGHAAEFVLRCDNEGRTFTASVVGDDGNVLLDREGNMFLTCTEYVGAHGNPQAVIDQVDLRCAVGE